MESRHCFPVHANNPKAIIFEACKTIRLNPQIFLINLEKELGHKINLENPLPSDWFFMCELLALDLNSISLGYFYHAHLNKIKQSHRGVSYSGLYQETYKIVSSQMASFYESLQSL